MYQIRKRDQHFAYRNGWLDARWHFSFSHYHDPENVNFGPLRVFNDDVIDGESGFPLHPHWNMEIVTVLTGGKLSHYDSRGHSGQIVPGEVQKMSAGAGIQHSEWNYEREPVRLMQIWFMPAREGLAPSYAQHDYSLTDSGLTIVGSPDGRAGGVPIYQDVMMAIADTGEAVEHTIAPGRGAYVHVIDGAPVLDGEELGRGDAARITSEHERVRLEGAGRVLIIDLPVREHAERATLTAGEAPAVVTDRAGVSGG